MLSQRIVMALPYAVMLALAAWFYHLAGAIEYTQRGANLGPDFWPRLALSLMMIICLVQIARLLLAGRVDERPSIGDSLGEEGDDAPRSDALLAAGAILTVAYGLLVTVTGFLITTFAFMVLFMYAGTFRRHRTIWLSSAIGVLLLLFAFQKVVYVSLPRGIPPFDAVSDWLLALI